MLLQSSVPESAAYWLNELSQIIVPFLRQVAFLSREAKLKWQIEAVPAFPSFQKPELDLQKDKDTTELNNLEQKTTVGRADML